MTTETPQAPRVGCGAAIFVECALLLVRRRRNPEADHWGLPGGKVDPFEPLPIAVAREIREELGIAITPTTLLCVVDQIDAARGDHWVSPVYLVESFAGAPAIQEPEALSELGWFPLDALPKPLTVSTIQSVAALKARL